MNGNSMSCITEAVCQLNLVSQECGRQLLFYYAYISAYGHYGEKSQELLKHYAQDLGFQYLSATDKTSFLAAMKEFTATEHKEKPILFEVLMDEHEDVQR